MNFIEPHADELAYLRRDPLFWEQELDVWPEVAEAIEAAMGTRAGQVYWRSDHDHLYGLELADTGRGRPAAATVFGYWERYEPRPPEHELDRDLLAFLAWFADCTESIERVNVERVAGFHGVDGAWPEGSVLRTPDECFADLPDFPYEPQYRDIEGLRMAYVEAGEGDPILMLHGEPTWSYLYRRMIPPLSKVGRCIAPDLIGFGRSDKPVADNAYSYRAHVRWIRKFIEDLDLKRITLICQDWGGLAGLRVLSQIPERFARVVATNTSLPGGGGKAAAFDQWRTASQKMRAMDVPRLMKSTLQRTLSDAELAAYGAPYPAPEYQTAALVFPRLVPNRAETLAVYENLQAIERLKALDIPVFLPWGDKDPITAAGQEQLQGIFKNASAPANIENAGHFIQDDAGEALAEHIVPWMG